MAYGLTDAGFTPATLEEVKLDLETDMLGDVASDLDLDPDNPIGQHIGIFSSKLAEVWELLDVAFGAFDDTKAEGSLLDALCALTGTKRPADAKGTVTVTCTLTNGTVLPDTVTVSDPLDPSNTWKLKTAYTATFTGAHDLVFECTRVGVVPALAGKLTNIDTPVAGWSAATNALDAATGRLQALDSELRLLRRAELPSQGDCSVPALRAALLQVSGVVSVNVKQNTSMVTDSSGRPPKSVEAIIWDGITPAALNASIIETIAKNTAAGIESHGDTTGTYTDAYGEVYTVKFTRVTQVEFTVTITVTQDPNADPYSASDIKAAIVAYGNTAHASGATVVIERIKAVALVMPGVFDVTACTLDTPAISPTTGNVTLAENEFPVFDTSRVTVS